MEWKKDIGRERGEDRWLNEWRRAEGIDELKKDWDGWKKYVWIKVLIKERTDGWKEELIKGKRMDERNEKGKKGWIK